MEGGGYSAPAFGPDLRKEKLTIMKKTIKCKSRTEVIEVGEAFLYWYRPR